MDLGARRIQVYLPTSDEWVWRYTGWFIPFRNEKTCGHRHETEERALQCAQTLLTKVRKDSR
jgi:hypothetical protein